MATPTSASRLGAACALGGALLWGGTVPIGKLVTDSGVGALAAAGMVYLGAALGLGLVLLLRRRAPATPRPTRRDGAWLLASAAVGAGLAPALLMFGQSRVSGLATALLLAVEPPATALIALAFGERLSRRVIAGAILVTVGAVLVGLRPGESSAATTLGALAVAGAATAWALDNNLSARVAHLDPVLVAAAKGALGGSATIALAALLPSASLAAAWTTASLVTILAVGFAGYGVGLALVIRALRDLGAARTGALFATAPLFGAVVSVMMGEAPTLALAIAAALLAAGVAAIVSEKKER